MADRPTRWDRTWFLGTPDRTDLLGPDRGLMVPVRGSVLDPAHAEFVALWDRPDRHRDYGRILLLEVLHRHLRRRLWARNQKLQGRGRPDRF